MLFFFSVLRDRQRCAAFSPVIRHSRPLSGHMFRRFISYGWREGGREGAKTNTQVRFRKPHLPGDHLASYRSPNSPPGNPRGRRIIYPRSVKALLHAVSVNKLESTWRAVFARLRVSTPHTPIFLFRFTVFCINARQTDSRQGLLPRRASSETRRST